MLQCRAVRKSGVAKRESHAWEISHLKTLQKNLQMEQSMKEQPINKMQNIRDELTNRIRVV